MFISTTYERENLHQTWCTGARGCIETGVEAFGIQSLSFNNTLLVILYQIVKCKVCE